MEVNWMLIAVTCAFMVLDIASGFAQACKNHCIDSHILKQGLWHKCGFMMAVLFGFLCEYTMQFVDLGFTIPVGSAVCAYIILTEIMSILENLGELSPELKDKKFMKLFASVDNSLTDADGYGKIEPSAAPSHDNVSNLSDGTGETPCGGSEDNC